jgi:hypothetical protein
MLLWSSSEDVLDFRSHFKFYLINIKWRTRLKEKIEISLKKKAVTWLPDNKTTEELQWMRSKVKGSGCTFFKIRNYRFGGPCLHPDARGSGSEKKVAWGTTLLRFNRSH